MTDLTSLRIGHGYDVHRLVEGRDLILGGVRIPHEKGLLGHSDADVLLHAVMDAILGALGEGDIGRHFPDSDERYRGISSMLLLEQVKVLADRHAASLVNTDVTVIAQKPKLAPYIPEMRENIARVFGVPTERVNIKATTEEKLGFTGACEGMAVHAVALLCLEK